MSRRCLVTGAGGFVGAGLVRRLLGSGHAVSALVGPGSDLWRIAEVASELRLLELDLRDAEALRRAVASTRPEWLFHLAAHGGYSWQTDRRRIFETNLGGTINLLEAVSDASVESVLCAGSSSEYGRKDHAPAEAELPEPNSDYAAAKAAATLFAGFVGRERGLPVATLRLYSVFGPFEEPARLVPSLVVHGLRGELPPLVDGAIARDFVYLDDVLDAFLLAAERGVEPGEVFNVGSGVETTIAAAVESARELFGLAQEPDFGSLAARRWDTTSWVADPRRIRARLGWQATASFSEGLARTAAWLEGRPDLWERYGRRAA